MRRQMALVLRRTDATAEPGTLLLAILYNRTTPESAPYPE
jgi:hypothetical protein